MRIADAINAIPDAADKVAVSMDVFGKSGANLLSLIQSGSDGMKQAIKEALEIGLAASREKIASVEEANDAISTMKSAFTGAFRTVTIAIAPFVKPFADGIKDAMAWLNGFRSTILEWSCTAQFVLSNFSKYVNLYFDKALLKIVSWANDVENIFTSVIPETFRQLLNLVTPTFDALTDYIAYSLVKITNVIVDNVGSWSKVLHSAMTLDFQGIGNAIDEALDSIKNRQEGEIERILREDSERSAKKLDILMGEAGNKIRNAFNRAKGPIEAALEESVLAQQRSLDSRLNRFVEDKMSSMGVSKKSGGAAETDFERSAKAKEKTENKAVERGTQEALKFISGREGDKQLKKMNEQLAEQKKANDFLRNIANRPALAKANL